MRRAPSQPDPDNYRTDDTDRLVVGGCRLSDLAERYGTPLYVLDEATVRATPAYRQALESITPGHPRRSTPPRPTALW